MSKVKESATNPSKETDGEQLTFPELKDTKLPVVEIFGPTIQGEGIDQGIPCMFVRFGGCDYKCDWCDTPYAVLPQAVSHVNRMTPLQIIEKLEELGDISTPEWIILSGGNPCLLELSNLIEMLHLWGHKVSVETQGSRWKPWLNNCDRVAVSPKPPSSGMVTDYEQVHNFMSNFVPDIAFLKVTVFDHSDYMFARNIHSMFNSVPMFLSVGYDAGPTVGDPSRVDERSDERAALDLITKYRWLVNHLLGDSLMDRVRVQCQQHILLWGNQRAN